MKYKIFIIIAVSMLISNIVCSDVIARYYKYSYIYNYDIPPIQKEEITLEQARLLRFYYKVEYDTKERVIAIEKYLQGKKIIRMEFIYHPNGEVKQYKKILSNGEINVFKYDEKGKTIK